MNSLTQAEYNKSICRLLGEHETGAPPPGLHPSIPPIYGRHWWICKRCGEDTIPALTIIATQHAQAMAAMKEEVARNLYSPVGSALGAVGTSLGGLLGSIFSGTKK